MTDLRVAVVGVGALGRHHARILSERENVNLVAVVDTNPDIAQNVAENCSCRSITDYREILEDLDAVSIVVPTSAHLKVARDFLERGIPVLVEKPLAINVAQSHELVNLAQENNTILQVGHIERFNPAMEIARPLVSAPKYIRAERRSPYAFRSTDIGAVLDLMIHDIDLVLDLADDQLESVEAWGLCLFGGHEDKVQARLKFENGCIADLVADRIQPTACRKLEILSLEGSLFVNLHSREVINQVPTERLRQGPSPLELSQRPGADISKLKEDVFGGFIDIQKPDVPAADALTAELNHFLQCVRTRTTPRVGGPEGLRAMQVAERILECVNSHQWDGNAAGPVGPHLKSA
ncbi:MAG: Gfo/Idh/MocA family oxidoreductase [Planctomycetaceae bacterium]